MASTEHPHLIFAARYGDPSQDYLNAYMASERLESLLEDLKLVSRLLEKEFPDETRWHPWFGAEAVSYYSVGFVTCLEWHAKSRLVDLLTFKPDALKIEDVRSAISDKLIVQMVAQRASVAQLVGAAVRVGTCSQYLSIFGRVFQTLGFSFNVTEWLSGQSKDAKVCWVRPERLSELDRIFEFRHELVHEIGVATMGHPNIRDAWSPEEAMRNGSLVASVISGIEAAISAYAPALFPNRLSDEGWPESKTDSLRAELTRLEETVSRSVAQAEWNDDGTLGSWQKANSEFRKYERAEMEFIDTAGMLHWRYVDARTPLRVALLEYRIKFLTELLSHLGESVEDLDATQAENR
jgi:hypothetical protein